jgi:S1-C subfamily serine protease
MAGRSWRDAAWLWIAALLGLAPMVTAALAQTPDQGTVAKADATVVVEGEVREVFRSPRQGRIDYLVQIEVNRSMANRSPQGGVRPVYPAPGDVVYVHLFQTEEGSGRLRGGHRGVPAERAQVRAYLTPRTRGGWQGTIPDWFELTSDQPAAEKPGDPPPAVASETPSTVPRPSPSPAAPPEHGKAVLANLGLTAEALRVNDRIVLRVVSVERGGPAQQAGLEPGDIIAGTKGTPLTSAAQLDDLAGREPALSLEVIDINTGRGVLVEVATGPGAPGRPAPRIDRAPDVAATKPSEPSPAPAAPSRSLGISAEAITIGQRTALKVVRVEPGSLADKAGLESGDVLVGANGVAITSPEQLATALRKSGSTLTLVIRDVRSGRDTSVRVDFGGPQPESPVPAPAANPPVSEGGSGGGRLGAVTELAFYDAEAAVKITEVEPNSPAARAGLQPGLIILQANGTPVLHPNELNEAVRKSGASVKLTVVDPRAGRKGTVTVDLGGR